MHESPPHTVPPRPTLNRVEFRCPPLPRTVAEAVELLDHPDRLDAAGVIRLVQRDPFALMRLLHVANSAYYGYRNRVSSAERVVVLLGPMSCAGIIVGMSLSGGRGRASGAAQACAERLVRHGRATAFLSRLLHETLPAPADRRPRGAAHAAGLLHDVGRLTLLHNFPDEAARLYDGPGAAGSSVSDGAHRLEQLLFGFDRRETGQFVTHRLRLSPEIEGAVRYHDRPEEAPPALRPLLDSVAAARLAAAASGYPADEPVSPHACAADPVWGRLADRLGLAADALLAAVHAQREALETFVEQ